MAIADAYARVTDIRQLLGTLPAATPTPVQDTAAPAPTSFQLQLAAALPVAAPVETEPVAAHADDCCCCCCCCGGDVAAATETAAPAAPQTDATTTGSVGLRALATAQTQIGQAEDPPGSNDGAALALYRSAVAGSYPGAPWCAYFVSWAAGQAGLPLGDEGQGLGSVAQIADWAQRTGRLLPQGATPQPGDLILFGDRHVGIVETVQPDGSLETVEGNYRNQVSRVHRSPSEATGFVRL